jgi:hypothetical protein
MEGFHHHFSQSPFPLIMSDVWILGMVEALGMVASPSCCMCGPPYIGWPRRARCRATTLAGHSLPLLIAPRQRERMSHRGRKRRESHIPIGPMFCQSAAEHLPYPFSFVFSISYTSILGNGDSQCSADALAD